MQTIQLKESVTVDGSSIAELSIRKPRVRDLLAIENVEGEALKEVALIANLASVSRETIEGMYIEDYAEVQKVLKDFLSPLTQRS